MYPRSVVPVAKREKNPFFKRRENLETEFENVRLTMSRKDDAYNYISEQILSNQLQPGTPVSEVDVASKLNISRTPVREALRDLASDGLVISLPSRGSFVSTLSPYDVEEIGDLRILLECWSLERGIQSFTEEEISSFETRFQKAYDKNDWKALHEVDRAFHSAIVEHSGSRRVAEFARTLFMQIDRIRRTSAKSSNRSDASLREHLKILYYIRKKDLRCAQAALTEHLCSVSASAIETSRMFNRG